MVGVFFARFSSVFLPLAVAAVLALVVRPYFLWLARRMPQTLALVLVFLSILLPFAGLGWFVGEMLVGQISELVANAPETWKRLLDWVEARYPQLAGVFEGRRIGEQLRSAASTYEQQLVAGLQSGLSGVLQVVRGIASGVGALLAWAVLPVYFAFFLILDPRKAVKFEGLLPFLKPETRANVVYLVHEFVEILVAFFRGQLIVAFLQGLLYAIGFTAIGLQYGMVLGLALGFLNIIPYLGSIVGLGIGLPLGFFQEGGGLLQVVWVLVVFTVVQMIEGYFLTPKIMGERTGLHPMAIIIAVFFWGSALNGIAGMILAIPLTAFLVVFWRLARERYISELV
jgi:predicted PurR-regulated permease PerM